MSLIKNPLQMTFLMLLWGMLFTLILYLLTEEGITLNFGPSEDRFFLSIQICKICAICERKIPYFSKN